MTDQPGYEDIVDRDPVLSEMMTRLDHLSEDESRIFCQRLGIDLELEAARNRFLFAAYDEGYDAAVQLERSEQDSARKH